MDEDRCQVLINPTPNRLFVDVSVLYQRDSGTGIQRVVKMICQHFCAASPVRWQVVPVAATASTGFRRLSVELPNEGISFKPVLDEGALNVRPGDVFFGLDLNTRLIVKHRSELLAWKRSGVRLAFLVYDLLPLSDGKWFGLRNRLNFVRWFTFVRSHADKIICISETVAVMARSRLRQSAQANVSVVPLGWDSFSNPTTATTTAEMADDPWFSERPTVLAVGTIEPRKGYANLIAAFEWLLHHVPDRAPNLLCVGRPGWKSGRLQATMRRLADREPRFRWVNNANDAELRTYYYRSTGLVAASRGEGFGLPVVEALNAGLPVLARDLPVFREIKSARLTYFDGDQPNQLGLRLLEWLDHAVNETRQPETSRISWEQSSLSLLHLLEAPGKV